jgi:hypothetical protein
MPTPGSLARTIFSGVFSATSSISMPRRPRRDDRLAGSTIEHDARVELARHLQPFFDEDAADDAAFK